MLKLKKNVNKEYLPEFIEGHNNIKHTEEDVEFYNEYLDNEDVVVIYDIIKLYLFCSLGTIFSLSLLKINGLLEILCMGFLFMIMSMVVTCKGFKSLFKSFELFYKLKKLKYLEFNNHYFLKQKISKMLEEKDIQINDNILNKIIKKYPEKEIMKNFLNNGVFKDNNQEKIYNDYKAVIKYLDQ